MQELLFVAYCKHQFSILLFPFYSIHSSRIPAAKSNLNLFLILIFSHLDHNLS